MLRSDHASTHRGQCSQPPTKLSLLYLWCVNNPLFRHTGWRLSAHISRVNANPLKQQFCICSLWFVIWIARYLRTTRKHFARVVFVVEVYLFNSERHGAGFCPHHKSCSQLRPRVPSSIYPVRVRTPRLPGHSRFSPSRHWMIAPRRHRRSSTSAVA